ncbi:MAG: inositol monophosphatase family protein [Arenicella sp.]|jgi:myo-inositol-1(or 4)-monophosphatase|nr:inositol monophosphatase family protein [Arenicella sp.]
MEPNLIAGALNVATNAALEAGRTISQNITQLDRVKVNKKSTYEMVSEVDIRAEADIIEILDAAYPKFNILSEESGKTDRQSDVSWIIDPMDGTHNFLHGHPQCAVSIALVEGSTVLLAVVYDPLRNELFTARKGGGAKLDGRRMRVSEVTRLSDSLVCTGFPHREGKETKQWLRSFATMLPRAQSIHRTGSSVLDLAYTAAGRYDGLWQYGLKPWDTAAGSLLIQEAGGLIADISGDTDVFKSGNLVAGNPKVFEKMMHILKSA